MLFTKTHVKAMKLMFLFTFLAVVNVHATGIAQQTITYSGRGVSLQKIFSVIKKQTGYKFFYDDADLRESKPVTIDLNKASLEFALEKILANQPVQYKIEGRTIVITLKKVTADLSPRNSSSSDLKKDPPVTG